MKPSAFQTGLIGYPLGHSLSPELHRRMYQACGIDGDYNLFPFDPLPEGEDKFKFLLHEMRRGRLNGLNVTIPHKQKVMPYLDHLTDIARDVGAVNTIYVDGGLLIGDNTDADGFINDINKFVQSKKQQALIMGAGGAARAVAYGLLKNGWQITIAARRFEQAHKLVSDMDVVFPESREKGTILLNENGLMQIRSKIDLIINSTPVGMTPHVEYSPWIDSVPFPADAVIYDLIYNPKSTKLTRDAISAGLPAYTGMGMLVEQAALAFKRWTGVCLSREVLDQLIKEY